jgi:hypothetical protein
MSFKHAGMAGGNGNAFSPTTKADGFTLSIIACHDIDPFD